MAGPIALVNDKAASRNPIHRTEAGVYNGCRLRGDANNTEALGVCGKEPVTIGKMPTSITSVAFERSRCAGRYSTHRLGNGDRSDPTETCVSICSDRTMQPAR